MNGFYSSMHDQRMFSMLSASAVSYCSRGALLPAQFSCCYYIIYTFRSLTIKISQNRPPWWWWFLWFKNIFSTAILLFYFTFGR